MRWDAQLEQSKAALADTYGLTTKRDEQSRRRHSRWDRWRSESAWQFIKGPTSTAKLSSLMDNPAR